VDEVGKVADLLADAPDVLDAIGVHGDAHLLAVDKENRRLQQVAERKQHGRDAKARLLVGPAAGDELTFESELMLAESRARQ